MTPPKRIAAKRPAAKKAATKKATPTRSASTKKKAAAPRRRGAAANPARDLKVLELRNAGVRFDDIVVRLKFRDIPTAHAAYERALDATLPPTVEENRRAELARLDQLQADLWPRYLTGDLAAFDQLAKVAEERQRLTSTDPLPVTGPRERGPIETAVATEVERLNTAAPALGAAALELARQCDETKDEPGVLASAARELRMTMSQLRGLAQNVNPDGKKSDGAKDDEKPGKGDGVVIEPGRLERLRELMHASR